MGTKQLIFVCVFTLTLVIVVNSASINEMNFAEFTVGLSWDGKKNVTNPAKITLTSRGADLQLSIFAHYYDDPPPPNGVYGEAYFGLWDYEVVEAFFLNDNDDYLELEFGPHGQHLMLMLHGERNAIKHSLPLDYNSFIDKEAKTWTGVAYIPESYFPPSCTKFNGYAIHGTDENREYEAVFEVSGPQPDFHRIHKFGPFDLPTVLPANSRTEHSDLWNKAIEDASYMNQSKQ
eukprot:TRINITY_DN1200_c0_g1_i3.p1 TRINITY_DN1200_c0_g1~~TRINITY_DN1200_c0_g1_i3.p1  ORF type:complete len:247 (-),score=47.20 TRINITY_DN1200_c0_g1_i3:500-1198(-)